MAGTLSVSLFQEMDISRYVKTVQDRIASGVRDALRSQGFETDQFEQQIVQISEGGVYIGSMSGGAVAAGAAHRPRTRRKAGDHDGRERTGQRQPTAQERRGHRHRPDDRWRGRQRREGAGGGPLGARRPARGAGRGVNPRAGARARRGGIAVGEVLGGALAAGREAEAVDASRELLSVPPGLLAAVRELRGQLPLFTRAEGDGLDAVDGELAELEEEAGRTGRAERGRLERLRALLTGGTTAVGGLASAFAVVQAISQLLA
ncbi:hypothetical protein ACFQ2B_11650 [Streptomyces stramineus]